MEDDHNINLEQIIECPICLSVICEPITLYCGHSFCRICLVHYLSQTSIKRCVTCRSICNLNPEDAKENVMLMNLAVALKPDQYKMKLQESLIEKNSWKQSILLYRTIRLDIYPSHETTFHFFESCDKAIVDRTQNTHRRFACCHYSNQHIAFVVVVKDVKIKSDNSYFVTATVLKNRFSILAIADDSFTDGLKTCLLQDLHDDPCTLDPRPWVSLPASFYTNNNSQLSRPLETSLPEPTPPNTSTTPPPLPPLEHSTVEIGDTTEAAPTSAPGEANESSELAEVLWLHDVLRDLIKKYISFRHRKLNGYRRDAPLPFLEPDLLATPEEYSLWAVGILPNDTVTLQKKQELILSASTVYRLRECVRLFELSNLKISQPKRLFESLDIGMNYGGTLAGGIIFTIVSCIGIFWFGIRFHFPLIAKFRRFLTRS